MFNTDIHKVASIQIDEIKDHSTFGTRRIVITNTEGQKIEITAFADDKESLKVDVNGTVNLKL